MNDIEELLRSLKGASNLMMKFSNIAAKKKQIKQAKELDLFAVSIYRAMKIIEENDE